MQYFRLGLSKMTINFSLEKSTGQICVSVDLSLQYVKTICYVEQRPSQRCCFNVSCGWVDEDIIKSLHAVKASSCIDL